MCIAYINMYNYINVYIYNKSVQCIDLITNVILKSWETGNRERIHSRLEKLKCGMD